MAVRERAEAPVVLGVGPMGGSDGGESCTLVRKTSSGAAMLSICDFWKGQLIVIAITGALVKSKHVS